MALIVPSPEQALAGTRAFKTVLGAGGPIRPLQRAVIEAAQRHFTHVPVDLDAISETTPEEIAPLFPDPAQREQLVHVMCALLLTGEQIRPDSEAALRRFAAGLGVDEPMLANVRRLVEGRTRTLQLDMLRRYFIGPAIAGAWEQAGLRGLWDVLKNLAGFAEDAALAARFDALEQLPAGTLGRELWDFYARNGFVLPGKKGGSPLQLLGHDFGHVLGGYAGDKEGEIQMIGFQAGFQRDQPFGLLFFLLLHANLGIKVALFSEPEIGYLASPGALERFFLAYRRGAAMNVDLMGDWDYWAVLDQPVATLRERYGIPPA
jgi:hypothetical protein